METKEFRETIEYLQEDNNCAIDTWRNILADVIGLVVSADENDSVTLVTIEELSNLRGILDRLKKQSFVP